MGRSNKNTVSSSEELEPTLFSGHLFELASIKIENLNYIMDFGNILLLPHILLSHKNFFHVPNEGTNHNGLKIYIAFKITVLMVLFLHNTS